MKTYPRLTATLIVAWFVVALAASALHLFTNTSSRIGLQVAAAALTPLIVFFVWFALSKNFRQFTMTLNPSLLTAAQTWRILGFTFVLLEAHRALPAVFALPAGYGDMFIGATATLVAWKLAAAPHRRLFTMWQLLGIADLVIAVTTGVLASQLDPHGVSTALMTVLPLSLIPTFFVPLFFIFHIICIAQARKWQSESFRHDRGLVPVRPISLNA